MAQSKKHRLPLPSMDPTFSAHAEAIETAKNIPPEEYIMVLTRVLAAVKNHGVVRVLSTLERMGELSQGQRRPQQQRSTQSTHQQPTGPTVSIDDVTSTEGDPENEVATSRPFG